MPTVSLIKKADGELIPFEREKLISSLVRSGAKELIAHDIADKVEKDLYHGMRTQKIYDRAYKLLKQNDCYHAACTYQLKRAVFDLGPSGFPFEHLITIIYSNMGYQAKNGIVLQGKCVKHEVDVLLENDKEVRFLECKFHNQQGVKSDVKIAMYVHSRIRDLTTQWQESNPDDKRFISGGLITNTKLTEDAVTYVRCSGFWGVSWDYPNKFALIDQMRSLQLLPITLLKTPTKKEKQTLLENKIILCKELLEADAKLSELNFTKAKRELFMHEAQSLIENYVL